MDWRILALVVGPMLGAGCTDEPANQQAVVELAIVTVQNRSPVDAAPAVVSVGETFSIALHSWGTSCVSADSSLVEATESGVTITVYDRELRREGSSCTALLMEIPHVDVPLSFATSGSKTVVIHGAQDIGGEVDIPILISVQ